jgi:hypothetical protein
LITRHVLDLLIAMPKRHRFVRGRVAWIDGDRNVGSTPQKEAEPVPARP